MCLWCEGIRVCKQGVCMCGVWCMRACMCTCMQVFIVLFFLTPLLPSFLSIHFSCAPSPPPTSLSPSCTRQLKTQGDSHFHQQWVIPSKWSCHTAIPCSYQATFSPWPMTVEQMILSPFTGAWGGLCLAQCTALMDAAKAPMYTMYGAYVHFLHFITARTSLYCAVLGCVCCVEDCVARRTTVHPFTLPTLQPY